MQQELTIRPPAKDGDPLVVTQTQSGVPTSRAEYLALRAKREALSDQLISAAGRRKDLAEELKSADASARPGLLERIKVLDDRIVRLENEIDRTGELVANTSPLVMSRASVQDPGQIASQVAGEIVPLVAILSIFVFMPIAIALSRLIWRRASGAPRQAVTDHATQQRLEQLQQSVDTIAIEVERISEGQRFVTRMMSDRAVGGGAAEPAAAPKKPAVPSERR